jgi:hypothetical protein
LVMTYADCFWVLGVGLIVLMPMVLLLRGGRIGLGAPQGQARSHALVET